MTEEDVQRFLYDFFAKMKTFDIRFLETEKNYRALAELDINPGQRMYYIRKIKPKNYFAGPKTDTDNPHWSEYWEFGMDVKGTETYVKLSRGARGKRTLCISFHPAEYKIKYKYK